VWPQDIQLLTDIAGGYPALASGIPMFRPMPFEGVPFLGAHNPLAFQLGESFGRPWMAGLGMMPMGVGHDQNIYDRMMSQRFHEAQAQAVAQASRADRQQIMRSFRGMFAATGVPFGPEQQQLAWTGAGFISSQAPMLAQFAPGFLEDLGGRAGSSAVLARELTSVGRYRLDPATGNFGIAANTVGRQADDLFRELYAPGAIGQMHGVRAGELGQLAGELNARGLLPGVYDRGATVAGLSPSLLAEAGRRTGVNVQRASRPSARISKISRRTQTSAGRSRRSTRTGCETPCRNTPRSWPPSATSSATPAIRTPRCSNWWRPSRP